MRYPIGIQDFRRLRTDGYVYVDKTRQIIGMLDAGVALFLSRPRRFGKSLTVSTLAELYGGERGRPLFEGLWAQDNWDFARMERPVIWLQLARMDTLNQSLEIALRKAILFSAERMGLKDTFSLPADATAKEAFDALIRHAANGSPAGRCVVLIDEYDKPMVDYLHDIPRAESNRETLKTFYGTLKDAGDQVELVFLTGVSAFSKVSIFSDLNHVVNLTLHHRAHTVVGVTGAELNTHFSKAVDDTRFSRDDVRRWYNGYSWGGPEDERVYNPWSLFNFFNTRELDNYWFETGTPTWLVRMMRDRGQYDPTGISLNKEGLTGFRLDSIDTTSALFQTGYLTVAEVKPDSSTPYTLGYPNTEVRRSLQLMLLASYLDAPSNTAILGPTVRIADAFRQNDLGTVFIELNALLAGVPYDLWQRGDEAIYHAIVHLTFSLIGVDVRSEVHTSKGRCDSLVETDTHVYALEFKLDRPVAKALAQVRERGYLEAYAASAKTCVAVGVAFDSTARRIGAWGIKEISTLMP